MNDLSATGVDRIRRAGILADADSGGSVAFNHIGGMDSGDSQDAFGIALGTLTISATAIAPGGVTNALVQRNRINGVVQTGTFSAAGIAIAGGSVGQNTIVNNMISGVSSNATAGDLSVGIFVAGASGSRTRVLSNSVLMSGDRGATTTWPLFGIAISGADPMVESRTIRFATTRWQRVPWRMRKVTRLV
ncbi:MAG: hypothetical protein IPK97_21310 [Ahniella sp.]|nr:hypothetical protein [Ahniella sp.]